MKNINRLQEEIETLSKEIIESAEKKAETIIIEAKERSKKMLEDAKKEIVNQVREIYEMTEKRVERISDQMLFNTKLKFKRDLIKEKEKIIEGIFNQLVEKLKNLVNSEKYQEFLYKSIIKSINYLNENNVILILNENDLKSIDLDRIKKDLKKKNVNIEISDDTLTSEDIGGFIIKIPNKNFELNNTIKEIIERKKDYLRTKIAHDLFQEVG
ncbi:MAG: V-type ATP synthase subunit E [Candidatus Helarchaeota archaeon]